MIIDVNDRMNPVVLTEASISIQTNPIGIKNVKQIILHSKEGYGIPHFHIKRTNGNDCCVMLNDNKFFNHGHNNGLLSSKEQKELDRWLRLINAEDPRYTNFQALGNIWNGIPNVKFQVDLYRDFDYTKMGLYEEK